MNLEQLSKFINSYTFDIRVNNDVHYVNQKCTPDVVCFIADCILNTECATREFTKNDLWHTQFFCTNTRVLFGKPYGDNVQAAKEYDKVSAQPLELLAYSHVLKKTLVKGTWTYSINNLEVLEFISMREFNAYNFLYIFFSKVIKDSGLTRIFDEYKGICKSDVKLAHKTIYSRYRAFVKAHSGIKNDAEPDRMFHKVLNVIALKEQIPGSKYKNVTWQDLMYNRENWKDIGRNKDKSITRQEAEAKLTTITNENYFIEYQVDKAIKFVKKQQGTASEVKDELATGVANEVHHIFPKSRFPMLASYYENLILLTSSQHRQKAHPNGNTQVVNPSYQYVCLLAKTKTIENSILKGCDFYKKDSFIYVINTGFNSGELFALPNDSSFAEIRQHIINYYSAH